MFRRASSKRDAALIAYITCGDPDPDETVRIAAALIDAGVDALELGVPFSDPVADGPVIQEASQRSLARGTNMEDLFDVAHEIRTRFNDVPVIAFSYLNPVLSLGRNGDDPFDEFGRRGADAGIDALLLTDLPAEDAGDARRTLHRHRIGLVPLIAPTSSPARMKRISRSADGFIYYVSTNGVTGARSSLDPRSLERVSALRGITNKPIAVGFGVSNAEQFEALSEVADGVVVGSAIVRAIADGPQDGCAERAAAVVRSIRRRG